MPGRDWIFQATPDAFDFEAFAASNPGRALWRVSRLANRMATGDRVYLWHAKGKGGSPKRAGVIGLARIAGDVHECADTSPAAGFWIDPSEARELADRVEIAFERLEDEAVIPYTDLQVDPVFAGHALFTSRAGTNFALNPEQAARLAGLWDHAGSGESDDELLAALVASVENREAAWLARLLPRTLARCRALVMAADPARAAAYGITPDPRAVSLWERYMAPGGEGIGGLSAAFAKAYPSA